mgnify:CR=1 FL=1
MTRMFVDGIVSTKDTMAPKKLDVIIMSDEKGTTLSVNDGDKQFIIPIEPIWRYLQ